MHRFVLGYFLCLGPIALGVIASAILVLGYFLQVNANERAAFNALALQNGPPAVVQLAEGIEPTNGAREVVVQAELLWDHSYDLWFEDDFGIDYVVMFPLVAAGSTNTDDVLGVAMFKTENDQFALPSSQILDEWYVRDGKFGPVMNLNGRLGSLGQWDDLTAESFVDEGLTLPDDPVVVWPYIEGRAVALAPPSADRITIFGLLSKVAGVIGLFAIAKLVFQKKPKDEMQFDPEVGQAFEDETIAYDPEPKTVGVRPAAAQFVQDSPVVPQKSSLGLRKILIGLVGTAFVVLLVATVWGMVAAPTTSNDQASLPSVQETVATFAADAVVPDADPDRHWTDIDVTPIAEWFVAKFFLAVSGDTDAQLLLGGMIGGLFFGLVGLRWFFVMRRALQPRTTARFDSMGIN